MISRDEIGQHPASRNVVARLTFAAARSMRSLITVISLAAPCRTPPRAGTSPPKHSSRLWPWLSSHGNTSARIGNSVSLRPRGMRPSSCLSKDGCISCGKASHETGRTGWSFNEPIEPMRGWGAARAPGCPGRLRRAVHGGARLPDVKVVAGGPRRLRRCAFRRSRSRSRAVGKRTQTDGEQPTERARASPMRRTCR
jgi:hypothetical protein